ncbi:MAG: efflux RND transporter periplasmic adaptor subunit [Cyanobacteriota bacterium]|nr:efflux RND transporter periplasmic adaptor subunit [Cyanobacteriota bacterium]
MYNQRQHFKVGKTATTERVQSVDVDFFQKNVIINQLFIKLKNSFFCSTSILFACSLAIGLLSTGCNSVPKETAQATSRRRGGATAVDVAIAKIGKLEKELSYTGTTVPFQEISVRSQIEGQLLTLNVDIGDRVSKGYVIGLIDDALLKTALNQAEAELAALNSEVARAKSRVDNALTEVERARLELQQATSDAQRQQKLLSEGAIAQQVAEQTRTEAQTAAKAVRLAEKRVQTERQAVAAAKGRVVAQQAVVAQAKERKSYAKLTSPIAGVVLEKMIERGNLVQPGNEIIKIGDFSRVKIEVQISELELRKLEVGQTVEVVLDAFPNQEYIGTLKRISPAANSMARLIPVEVLIPNVDSKIGSGLLARVNFQNTAKQKIVVPIRAIKTEDNKRSSEQKLDLGYRGKVFIVVEDGSEKKVKTRSVILGEKADGKVEIVSGLESGESYVVRSSKPLKNGENVRLSIISETSN